MKHRHEMKVYEENAFGYWAKRECPGDGIYFHGCVTRCVCGYMQMVPDDLELKTVEVTA